MKWNKVCRAVRHKIRVENYVCSIVPSHTGRDNSPCSFFCPYQIPDGINSENYKELAI
jgi:hypothetical protein